MNTRTKKTAVTAAALLAAFMFTSGVGTAFSGDPQGKAGYEKCDTKDTAGHWYGKSSNEWKKTLTKEQKAEMSKLHLALKKELAPLKARINARRTDVRTTLAGDNPDRAALAKAADEISVLEKQAMQVRYEYMIKVRSLLTPEQKTAFDSGIVKDGEHDNGQRHRK